MGSLAHDLAVGRPFAFDGLHLLADGVEQARSRAGRVVSLWPRCWCRAANASAFPRLMRPTANRNVIEKMAQAIVHDTGEARRACRRISRRRRFPRCCCCPISGHRSPSCARSSASWRRPARAVMWCRWSIRRKKASPIRRQNRIHRTRGPGSVTAGRAETWRNDYQRLVADHRAALRAEMRASSAGALPSIAPIGRPTELLVRDPCPHGRQCAYADRRRPARAGEP